MNLTAADVRAMARALNLEIPDTDLENIRLRLSTLFEEMAAIERALGAEMDKVDPCPPVYPHEED